MHYGCAGGRTDCVDGEAKRCSAPVNEFMSLKHICVRARIDGVRCVGRHSLVVGDSYSWTFIAKLKFGTCAGV